MPTRLSEYLSPAERQAPADAEAVSRKLMVRAGLVRQGRLQIEELFKLWRSLP